MAPDKKTFEQATKLVIKTFEGGYYHPLMFRDGRLNPNTSAFGIMAKSGETMFGLDRHAGHSLYYSTPRVTSDVLTNLQYIPTYKYKSADAKQFWETIDATGAAQKWAWNYRGGSLEEKLATLAARVLYPAYIEYSNKYLTPQAQKIVANNPKLLFHFIYAVWNGPGFFKRWGKILNADVASGLNAEQLLARQIQARAAEPSIVNRSAQRMLTLFASPDFDLKKKAMLTIPAIMIAAGILIYASK